MSILFRMSRPLDLSGQRFTKLTALRRLPSKGGSCQWHCVCDCGKFVTRPAKSLRAGDCVSCGCYKKHRIHGLSKTPEYNSWIKMMQRCYNPTNKDYDRYHGKGIDVCYFIRKSVASLIEAIGRRPLDFELDRINNKSGYHCGKCAECESLGRMPNIRWASATTQSRNQDRIRLIEIDGHARCIGEWAEVTGIHYMTLMTRYKRGVRGPELIAPPGPSGRRYA